MKRTPRIEIIKIKTGWYFRIKAANGKILCHSEVYRSKQSAKKAVGVIKKAVMSKIIY